MATPGAPKRAMIEPVAGVPSGVAIRLKVTPGAKRNAIEGVIEMPDGPRLKVKVTAPPEDGKANDAVRVVLAKALGVACTAVEITAGHASRDKTATVRGVTLAQAWSACADGSINQ